MASDRDDEARFDDLASFEQDPESDDIGDGYFTRADGTRFYSSDPEAAKHLESLGKATTVSSVEPPPVVAGDGSEPLISAPPEEVPAEPERAAPVEAPAAPPLQLPRPQSRPLPLAATSTQQGATQSNQVQRTGSAMPQELYEKMASAQGGAFDEASRGADEAGRSEQQAYARHAQALKADAMARESAASAAIAENQKRQQVAVQQIQERSAQPIDNNKMWKDKGIVGTLAGLIGIMIGGATSAALGTDNPALKSIEEQKRQNIQSQLADRDSELRGLERQLGSLEAARPVFEARMNTAIQQRGDALMVDEKSTTARAAWQKYRGELEIEKQQKLAEGAKAQFGTLSQSQSQQQTLEQTEQRKAMPAGAGGPDLKKGFEILKLAEANGYDREQLAALSKTLGLPNAAGGETSEEFDRRAKAEAAKGTTKLSAEEAKAEAASASIDAYKDTLIREGHLIRDKDGKLQAKPGWRSNMMSPTKSENWQGFMGHAKPVTDARSAALMALGPLQSGAVISPSEAVRFEKALGNDEASPEQVASVLNALDAVVEPKRAEWKRAGRQEQTIKIGRKVQ